MNTKSTNNEINEEDLINLLQSSNLKKLENELLNNLNLFELAGLNQQEIKHSNFLSELLNPNSVLGQGDEILNQIVRDGFSNLNNNQSKNTLKPIDFELASNESIEVRREFKNIDLLVLNHDREYKYVIAIENKIFSKESKEQLSKYRQIIETDFTDYKKLYIFLTPFSDTPKWDEQWIPVCYESITKSINSIIQTKTINQESLLILKHYKNLLEKFIVGQPELELLANKIYQKHKKAIDFIFEKRFDHALELSNLIKEWIKSKKDDLAIKITDSNKGNIRFSTKEMEELSKLIPGSAWKSNDIIVGEFVVRQNSVVLKIILGFSENKEKRQEFLTYLQEHLKMKSKSDKYSTVYSITLAKESLDEVDSIETYAEHLLEESLKHLKQNLPQINDVINNYIKSQSIVASHGERSGGE
jgi:hypothetical protein